MLLQESSKFCPRCGTAVQSQSQNTQVGKPGTAAQESTGKVNLKKTEGVSGKGKVDLKKTGAEPKQADTAAMADTGFGSSGSSDAGNLSGTGFENSVHTNAGYASGTGMQNRTGMGAGKRQTAKIENRIGPERDRRKKVLIGAAVCAVVLVGILSVAQSVQKEDSSMDSAQQDEAWTGAAWQPEDTPEQEEDWLAEQQRQEELLEEQRRQEELLEEQRRQEELLEEQRRQEELLAEQEEDKVYVSEYEVVAADVTWKEAKKLAKERGGHLAVITSEEEQKKIEALVDQYDYLHTIWLGGRYKDGEFQWINGEDFDYTSWGPGEPNNETGDEFYLDMYELHDTWYWNDVPNDIQQYYSGKMGYVIEWEIEQ